MSLSTIPVDIINYIMSYTDEFIYYLRNLSVQFYIHIPMSRIYCFRIFNNNDLIEFANVFVVERKYIKYRDSVFDINIEYDIDHKMLRKVFDNINIRNLFICGRPGRMTLEMDLGKELELTRYKFPFAQKTILYDMDVCNIYLRRVNTNSLCIRRCIFRPSGMEYIPLLQIKELEIINNIRRCPMNNSIPNDLKSLTIDDTVFSEQLLFNVCLSNLESIKLCCQDIAEYVKHFPDTLKTCTIVDCMDNIIYTVTSLLKYDEDLSITQIATSNNNFESIYPTRILKDIRTDIKQYVLTKGDRIIYVQY